MANRDDDSPANLLCYLVIGQLIARARTGEWLRTGHLTELLQIWRLGNAACGDGDEEIEIALISADVAKALPVLPAYSDAAMLAGLFADRWMLDYASPVVCGIHAACATRLTRSR